MLKNSENYRLKLDENQLYISPPVSMEGWIALSNVDGEGWVFEKSDNQRIEGAKSRNVSGPIEEVLKNDLLVIYGTKSRQSQWYLEKRARKVEEVLIGAGRGELSGGHFRVLKDIEVTHEQLAGNNIWLIGTADENSIVEMFSDELPTAFDGGDLILGSSKVSRESLFFECVIPNPYAGDRYAFIEMANSRFAYSSCVFGNRKFDYAVSEFDGLNNPVLYRGIFNGNWEFDESTKYTNFNLEVE